MSESQKDPLSACHVKSYGLNLHPARFNHVQSDIRVFRYPLAPTPQPAPGSTSGLSLPPSRTASATVYKLDLAHFRTDRRAAKCPSREGSWHTLANLQSGDFEFVRLVHPPFNPDNSPFNPEIRPFDAFSFTSKLNPRYPSPWSPQSPPKSQNSALRPHAPCHYSLPTTHYPLSFCRPFVFILLRIAFPASPLL
jgi:hypothetical protein